MNPKIFSVAIVDDHTLFRKGLLRIVNEFGGFRIVQEASNGKDFIENFDHQNPPDLVLIDVQMPEMDGYETARWLREKHPDVKVIAISMHEADNAIIRMLKLGVRAYLFKLLDPAELKHAMVKVATMDYYLTEYVTGRVVRNLNNHDQSFIMDYDLISGFTTKEIEFLRFSCTEMTYKEIADIMGVSARTIDGYRDNLFEKLKVRSRVGLVVFAIRNNIFKIWDNNGDES